MLFLVFSFRPEFRKTRPGVWLLALKLKHFRAWPWAENFQPVQRPLPLPEQAARLKPLHGELSILVNVDFFLVFEVSSHCLFLCVHQIPVHG